MSDLISGKEIKAALAAVSANEVVPNSKLLDEAYALNEKEASLLDAYDDELRKDWRELGEPMMVPGTNAYVPRNGFLGLKALTTPMYLYNHPALRAVCNTAMTDGINMFVNLDFYKHLNRSVNESGGKLYGFEWLANHELMHMALRHVHRLKQFPHRIANNAEDYLINAKLLLAYPDQKPCELLRRIGLAMNEGEAEKYAVMSEEAIARMLWSEEEKERQKAQDKQKQEGGGPGEGQPGSGGQGGQKPGQGGGKGQERAKNQKKGEKSGDQGQGQPGQGQPGSGEQDPSDGSGGQPGQSDGKGGQPGKQETDSYGKPWDNSHVISPEDLIKIFKDNKMDNVMNALEYPQDGDPEKIGEMEQRVMQQDMENLQRATADMARHGSKYPGGPVVDAIEEAIMDFKRGKLSWKLSIKEIVFDEGMKSKHSDEEPGILYYVDEVTEAVGDQLYLGEDLPHRPQEVVCFIIDSSGSMWDGSTLREILQEVFEVQDAANGGDSATEVIIFSADTSVRGDPVVITRENKDTFMASGVGLKGKGGTDFVEPMRQVLASKILKDKKVRSIVYCTDTYGNPPTAEEIPKNIQVAWMVTPSTDNPHVEDFARKVQGYSRVTVIEQNAVMDLSETAMSQSVSVSARKPKKTASM